MSTGTVRNKVEVRTTDLPSIAEIEAASQVLSIPDNSAKMELG